ncbi:MAG: hypothetical protein LBR65_08555 [Culturomica sp.]|jgi:hypothetical protein|nr:hypothetical protein [Culturomica sp.]
MKKKKKKDSGELHLSEKNQRVLEEIEKNYDEDAKDNNSDYGDEIVEESENIGRPPAY